MVTLLLASLINAALPLKQENVVWLESLDISNMTQDWGEPHKQRSVNGTPIMLHGKRYEHGIGTHANSSFAIDLKGGALRFSADVGIDDEVGDQGRVRFSVYVDGRRVALSGVLRGGGGARHLDVPLTGARRLDLIVEPAGNAIDFDHADWADAQIVLTGASSAAPVSIKEPVEPPIKIYMGEANRPEINGARKVGCSPGKPFLFKIAASGRGPLRYSATPLPAGLTLDASLGIISGSVQQPGTYVVHVRVSGPAGVDQRDLTIVCGDHKLALTPPMGWNSWNVWGTSVTADKVKAAADSFIRDDLINYGYMTVNIDDAWEGRRDPDGNIQTNEKFGDIAVLASYVHSKGLHLGIYSSPGPKTCGGYDASYQHEQQDADSYAKWGIDYLKYDWCSYGSIAPNPTLDEMKTPYIKMRGCLDNCGRDIIFSLCQYGMGDVWNWGKGVGGNLWRTTGDISDNYSSMATIAFAQSDHASGAGPGGWNDPDMLVVGNLGWGDHPHPTGLKPNEQITHITMWSLLAAPLLLGCDLTHLDLWTKALITNHDVIDVDQDPLGKPAQRVFSTPQGVEVWSRPLWDGTIAVGLMNRDRVSQKITVTWDQLHLSGRQAVRDLWQRKNVGSRDRELSAVVPGHGATLFKVGATAAPQSRDL